MTVLITLTTAGSSTGPFSLYSNVDSYSVPFETGVSRSSLLAGYTSTLVPNGTTIVRVMSTGACTNYTDLSVVPCPTTTTTTTTAPPPPPTTTTTTTTGVGSFTISNPAGSGQIDNVYTTGGASFYFINSGSFPVTTGQAVVAGLASLTTEPVIVDISNYTLASTLSLYINGILNEQISVTASGTYTFNNKTFTTSDIVLLEYTS
jgi:hypothetical protein